MPIEKSPPFEGGVPLGGVVKLSAPVKNNPSAPWTPPLEKRGGPSKLNFS